MQENKWDIGAGSVQENLPGQSGGREEKAMLFRLAESSEKQLFYERARTVISVITALSIICALVLVVPALLKAAANVNEIITQASETMVLADEAIKSITEMSDSITGMGQNMDAFISENAESVSAVMEQIEAVDFEGLNKAIRDLGDVVEPFAKFFNRF